MEELREFDKQSTENMLIYYEEELRRVAMGESPKQFLPDPLILRLIAYGILGRDWGRKGRKITLTRKGREFYGL